MLIMSTLYKFAKNRKIWFPYFCAMAYIPFDARIAGSLLHALWRRTWLLAP